jgi:hypothetical protein
MARSARLDGAEICHVGARERLPSAVPQGGAAGEVLSPTQPFPTHVPDPMPERFTLDDVHNEVDRPSSRDEGSMITSAGARESMQLSSAAAGYCPEALFCSTEPMIRAWEPMSECERFSRTGGIHLEPTDRFVRGLN